MMALSRSYWIVRSCNASTHPSCSPAPLSVLKPQRTRWPSPPSSWTLTDPERRGLCPQPATLRRQVEGSDTVATLILTRAQHTASVLRHEAVGEDHPQR